MVGRSATLSATIPASRAQPPLVDPPAQDAKGQLDGEVCQGKFREAEAEAGPGTGREQRDVGLVLDDVEDEMGHDAERHGDGEPRTRRHAPERERER